MSIDTADAEDPEKQTGFTDEDLETFRQLKEADDEILQEIGEAILQSSKTEETLS